MSLVSRQGSTVGFSLALAAHRGVALLGACRTLDVDSENRPQRGQFLPGSQAHSTAMGQETGEKWTAAADLQPTLPKSDRLLGQTPSLAVVARLALYADGGAINRQLSLDGTLG